MSDYREVFHVDENADFENLEHSYQPVDYVLAPY